MALLPHHPSPLDSSFVASHSVVQMQFSTDCVPKWICSCGLQLGYHRGVTRRPANGWLFHRTMTCAARPGINQSCTSLTRRTASPGALIVSNLTGNTHLILFVSRSNPSRCTRTFRMTVVQFLHPRRSNQWVLQLQVYLRQVRSLRDLRH